MKKFRITILGSFSFSLTFETMAADFESTRRGCGEYDCNNGTD